VGSSSSSLSSSSLAHHHSKDNRPDAELMDRLSEALAVLPKDMQEQIVNRLIDSILSNAMPVTTTTRAVIVPSKHDDEDQTPQAVATPANDLGMPLAAATLASLLTYYSNLVKNNTVNEKPVKTLPVIPCHA
jgi:DNA polymerase III delta subunit